MNQNKKAFQMQETFLKMVSESRCRKSLALASAICSIQLQPKSQTRIQTLLNCLPSCEKAAQIFNPLKVF
jgi:hypothetical protein